MMSEQVWTVFGVVQIFFALVIGIYFIGLIKGQRQSKTKITINTQKEQERLEEMRKIQELRSENPQKFREEMKKLADRYDREHKAQ